MHWYGGIIRAYYWFPLKVPNQAYWTKTSYYHLENVLSCFNLSGVFCSSSMSSTRSTDVRLPPSIISIRSSANTSWPGVAYNVVWYVIFTAKSVATRRPYQGSSSSRQLFSDQMYVRGLLWIGDFFWYGVCLWIFHSCTFGNNSTFISD